jgi:hypothetical protein
MRGADGGREDAARRRPLPQEQLLAALQRHSRAHELFDMGALAREAAR